MRTLIINSIDRMTTVLCSAGPLSFVGSWWWRRRLSSVHSLMDMEQYEPRR